MSNPSIIRQNAQALELYMRVSPEAASFLDCFTTTDTTKASQIIINYEGRNPSDDAYCKPEVEQNKQMAVECASHLKKLFPGKSLFKRDEAGTYLRGMFDLRNLHLKNVILELAVAQINERRTIDNDYTLAHFQEDADSLRSQLSKSFSVPVTLQELEGLLPQLTLLQSVINNRPHHTSRAVM